MTDTPALPKDTFRTRRGKTIALKPWTFDLIAEHADDLRRYITTWVQVLNGDEEADLKALREIMPALKASVQSEDSLSALEGLSDMADFALAVWEYNEVGTGLGKFVRHRVTLHEGITAAMEAPSKPQPEATEDQNPSE